MISFHAKKCPTKLFLQIYKKVFKIKVQFTHLDLDPDLVTQVNADSCGSGSGSETLELGRKYSSSPFTVHNIHRQYT